MKKLLEILKAALTKFSAINMTQFVGIGTLIITSWQGANLIDPAMVLLLTSFLTLTLKLWQSSKEMVSTGFNLDWTVCGYQVLAVLLSASLIPSLPMERSWLGYLEIK
jgi:hypothetical protein